MRQVGFKCQLSKQFGKTPKLDWDLEPPLWLHPFLEGIETLGVFKWESLLLPAEAERWAILAFPSFVLQIYHK